MGAVALAAGIRFRMAFVAGGAGEARMHAGGGAQLGADAGMTVEAGVGGLAHQRQLQRSVRVAMADQTRPRPLDMPAALVAVVAGQGRIELARRMATVAVETAEKVPMAAAILLQILHLRHMALQAINFRQAQIFCCGGRREKDEG